MFLSFQRFLKLTECMSAGRGRPTRSASVRCSAYFAKALKPSTWVRGIMRYPSCIGVASENMRLLARKDNSRVCTAMNVPKWLGLVLFFACTSALGQDANEIARRLRSTYQIDRPVRVAVSEWSLVAAKDETTLTTYRNLDGITARPHEPSGGTAFNRRELLVTGDGTGRLRVEVLIDRLSMPRVPVRAIWGTREWARPEGNDPDGEVLLIPIPDLSCAEKRDSHARGEVPFARVRGEESFVEMVRWICLSLECAKEIVVRSRSGDETTIEAVGTGLFITLGPGEQSLRKLRAERPGDLVDEWRWEGVVGGEGLAGVHPKFQYMHSGRAGDKSERHGTYSEFFAVDVVDKLDDSIFQWSEIGEYAWDKFRRVVIDHKGTVDEERTAHRRKTGMRLIHQKECIKSGPPSPKQ